MIALSGCPGAGKSHVSTLLRDEINRKASKERAVILPLDGFHKRRDSLSPADLLIRGHPSTFHVGAFLSKIRELRYELGRNIYAPAFNHALKDPVENAVMVTPEHDIVICEGIYVLLPEWLQRLPEGVNIYDILIFVYCAQDLLERRITRRHVEAGICSSQGDALLRYQGYDRVNASIVMSSITTLQTQGGCIDFLVDNTGPVPTLVGEGLSGMLL